MPKRTDIKTILIIGAGPIVIGQACEFDYSGTQACKTLKAEGYRIVLINSNPATIMTDPDLAHATYIEPITPEIVAKIIEKERDVLPGGFALLPTMGGQTALNTALTLRKMGVLDKFNVELIGATANAIDKAEDRELFREAMKKIGLETPRSHQVKNLPDALKALDDIGLPAIIRPSFTLGGTGDSITVAPALTLTDKEYQVMRDASIAVLREIGVETGGSNVQFAVEPETGRLMIIEMNPRVSR